MNDYWKEVAGKPTVASAEADKFLVPTNQKLGRQVNNAAGWMWAMAALSGVNFILIYVHAPIQMTLSLFVSDVIFSIGYAMNPITTGVALVIDIVILGFLVLLGFQIRCWRTWAFIVSITLVALDAVLIYFTTTLAGLWPFLLHGLAIYFLMMGSKAAKILNQRRADGQV